MFRGSQDLLLWLLARPRLHHGLNRKVIERFVQARAGLAVDVIHDGAHELLSRHIGGRTFTGKSFKKCSHLAKTHPLHKQRGIVVGEEIPTAGHHAGGGVEPKDLAISIDELPSAANYRTSKTLSGVPDVWLSLSWPSPGRFMHVLALAC